jgi:hypothetical protein
MVTSNMTESDAAASPRRWFPYDHIVAYDLRVWQTCESGFRVLKALPGQAAMDQRMVRGFARSGPTMPSFVFDKNKVASRAGVLRMMRRSREGKPFDNEELQQAYIVERNQFPTTGAHEAAEFDQFGYPDQPQAFDAHGHATDPTM